MTGFTSMPDGLISFSMKYRTCNVILGRKDIDAPKTFVAFIRTQGLDTVNCSLGTTKHFMLVFFFRLVTNYELFSIHLKNN